MQVSTNLKVNDKEFYKVLITSLIAEIKQVTGKTQKPYRNLQYTNELSVHGKNTREVRTKITELTENKCYEVQVEHGQGVNTVRFDIEAIGETNCRVTYSESFIGSSGKVQANFGLVSFFVNPFNKRKAKKKLKAMETYIIHNR